jgi:Reverse transcriptase (RNA-dependent DNA polymerase)
LEAKKKECVYIVAGPEFGKLEGHVKALYILRTSGLRFYEQFVDCLGDIGFFRSKAESDIWMGPGTKSYEYIGVCVDDLAIVASDPKSIIDQLSMKYDVKLRGTGPIQYHLGLDFFQDSNGGLCISTKQHINQMIS